MVGPNVAWWGSDEPTTDPYAAVALVGRHVPVSRLWCGGPDPALVTDSDHEAVPDPRLGDEIPRAAGVRFKLAAQLVGVDAQVVGLAAV